MCVVQVALDPAGGEDRVDMPLRHLGGCQREDTREVQNRLEPRIDRGAVQITKQGFDECLVHAEGLGSDLVDEVAILAALMPDAWAVIDSLFLAVSCESTRSTAL